MKSRGFIVVLIILAVVLWHRAGKNTLPERSVSVLELGSVSIGSAENSLAGNSLPDGSIKAFYAFDKKTGFDAGLFDTKKMAEKN